MSDNNQILCPYCLKVICDDDGGYDQCKHYYSGQDDIVDWEGELSVIRDVLDILDNYDIEKHSKELNSMIKDLKIGKELKNVINYGSYFEDEIEMITKDISIINKPWDGAGPGLSGVFRFLFVKDIKNINWLIEEFKILHLSLLEFDKKHDKLF